MKVEANFEYEKCNLCESDDSTILFNGRDRVHKKDGLFTVVKCNNCGLIYTNPRPKQTIISEYYPEVYWDIKENEEVNFENKLKKVVHKSINKIYYQMKIPSQYSGKVLDIGCGDGKLLSNLKNTGWETYGVEISDLAVEFARKKYGLNIFEGVAEDAMFEDEFFDVIILSHVLEHLPDPKATLKEINRILKPNGLLIISIPNVNSFEAKHFKKYWTAWELPRHFYHFSNKTVETLLNKTGFNISKINYDTNPNIFLSSFKYLLEDLGINPLVGLILIFPFSNILSLIIGNIKQSSSMTLFIKKI
jgi:methionine biosynthesis protein MetW